MIDIGNVSMHNTTRTCNGLDTCVQSVIGGVGALLVVATLIAILLSIIIVVAKWRRKAKHQRKTAKHGTTKNVSEGNQSGLNQTGDYYAREIESQLTSHDYDSIHLSTLVNNRAMMSPAELEKGGRYTHAGKQEHNNYEEVADKVTNQEQRLDTTTAALAHGYDVPNPLCIAAQPSKWDGVQSYEKPEHVVTFRSNKRTIGFTSRLLSADRKCDESGPVQVAYDLPLPLSKSSDSIAGVSAPSSRKVSDSSVLPSALSQEKCSAQSTSPYLNNDQLQQLKSEELPDYVNVEKSSFLVPAAALPIITSSPHENPVPVVKRKPQIKMKPALPSKLFKPTAELSQILDVNRKVQTTGRKPLTPNGMQMKFAEEQTTISARSQTWTFNRNFNVKQQSRKSNYTPIDLKTMDPKSDYDQL